MRRTQGGNSWASASDSDESTAAFDSCIGSLQDGSFLGKPCGDATSAGVPCEAELAAQKVVDIMLANSGPSDQEIIRKFVSALGANSFLLELSGRAG